MNWKLGRSESATSGSRREDEQANKEQGSLEQQSSSDDGVVEGRRLNSYQDSTAETRAVWWLKLLLLFILITTTIAVALLVYFYSKGAEQSEFEARFEDEASKMQAAVTGSFYNSLSALDSYVVDLVSYAEESNSEWPLVSLPRHAVRGAKLRALSRAFYVGQYHLVTDQERETWEEYSLENSSWVDEGLEIQKDDINFHGVQKTTYEPSGKIYDTNFNIVPKSSYYLPTWNCYPIVPIFPPFNWDLNTYQPAIDSFRELFEDRKAVMRITNIPDLNDPESVAFVEPINQWAKDYISEDENEAEPIVEIYYPISTESVLSVQQAGDPAPGSVVGVLSASVYWRELLENILPAGTGGIVAVFEIGDWTFTYAVDGPKITFLGNSDEHDSRYNHMGRTASFLQVEGNSAKQDAAYTGLPLNEESRKAKVFIYPSEAMEQNFVSNTPIVYTVVAVLTFAFTSALFIIYDRLRSKALDKATNTAVKSKANVVLLEDMVKKRTHELETTNNKLEEANREVVRASEARLRHFACMSHEIRTPLNCVIGMSSLLRDSDLPPMQAEAMQMIMSSGELLLTIVNDVLDYSKLESGNVDIVVKRSNLSEALSASVHSMNLKGESSNVKVKTFYDVSVPEFIDTDVRRLSQILYNLLGNAFKFSRPGHDVEFSVSVCQAEEEPVESTSSSDQKYSPPRVYKGQPLSLLTGHVLRFVIKDNGRGIKREDFPKIFQPFLQADQNTEALYGGTGLGLSITSKLVHGLGGSISVVSVEGQWAEFTIDFPHVPSVKTDSIARGLQSTRVLFVGCGTFEQERMADVFRTLQVEHAFFSTFQDLQSGLAAHIDAPTSTTTCVYVVNEAVHDPAIYNDLSTRNQSVLLTFGPNFTWHNSRHHYRSLTQVLPSVFLRDVTCCVQSPGYVAKGRMISSSSDPAAYKKLRILIAEDNLVNQKVLSRILSRLGAEDYEIVGNGQLAVEREARERFDVVLMDMQMPIMSGTEATERISSRSEEGSHPRANVIFVTAHVADHFEQECRDAGAVGFVSKPCTIDRVEECLQKLVMGGYTHTSSN